MVKAYLDIPQVPPIKYIELHTDPVGGYYLRTGVGG